MGVAERKERDFLRREQEILDAALALFSSEDWQTVTVEQIAERAEIGKGTVYKHFASKDEIYARLATQFQEQGLRELEQLDPKLPVIHRLRCIIEIVWKQQQAAEEHQHIVQYCEREDFRKSLPADVQQEMTQLDERFMAAVNRVLQDGIDEGLLPKKPLDELIIGPMAALQGAAKLGQCGCMGPDVSQQHVLSELTNFILAGMLYQEWLADEGLAEADTLSRAQAEVEELEWE
jgi:AcrR family transcriptional regulator